MSELTFIVASPRDYPASCSKCLFNTILMMLEECSRLKRQREEKQALLHLYHYQKKNETMKHYYLTPMDCE